MILHVVIGVFIWLLGLCVGSFLNVVVYRLPIGLSIRKPARSFCPSCKAGIAWYDNVPVLSWLLLRGRCRHCQTPISPQYPLVEAVTGFAFVLVYYLVFVARTRVVVGDPSLGSDIPLLAAWLVLVGVLMACAAMDVVSYLVDTRITDLAIGAGIVLHALWPRQAILAGRAESPLGAAALAAFVVSGLLLWRTVWRPDSASDARETDEGQSAAGANQAARSPQASQLSPWVGRLAIVVFVGLTLWLLAASGGARQSQGPPVAAGVGLLAMFVATVVAGGQRRVADEELAEALAEEGPLARRVALRELLWLSPAVAAAIGAYSLVAVVPTVGDAWGSAVRWPKDAGFAPLGGAVFAIYGAMIAATAGWVLRIVFTLLLGAKPSAWATFTSWPRPARRPGGTLPWRGCYFRSGWRSRAGCSACCSRAA
ncbi:MAG: prepilin peptidase [Planctomycetes bacterium]|nr:prepilin peptidase [Planctomycetota bacterium]